MRALEPEPQLPPCLRFQISVEVLVQRRLVVVRDHAVVGVEHRSACIPRYDAHELRHQAVVLQAIGLGLYASTYTDRVVLKPDTSTLSTIRTNSVESTACSDTCVA